MKKILSITALFLLSGAIFFVSPGCGVFTGDIKNVIVLISDGTSVPVLTLSRWYQWGVLNGDARLAVDPYLSGLVKTHSSDAVIGDSAPTASTYFTGYWSRSGFISTYPDQTPNDIYPVDSSRAFQPLATVGEAMRILQGKSVGLVVTCEFPHATPADAMSHSSKRSDYASIGSVMVHNGIDVMFGGGTNYISDTQKEYLGTTGTGYMENDLNAFRGFSGNRLWALFGNKAQPYDMDRDTAAVPSLAEMTSKALDMLSRNRKGFFLMVEGSKVDWAAHYNDVIGAVTEFLAFDAAVKEAVEFAKRDKNTLVLVLADHGTGGISIGGPKTNENYDTLSLESLIGPLGNIKLTPEGLAQKINDDKVASGDIVTFIGQYMGINDLSEDEIKSILSAGNYFANDDLPKEERWKFPSLEMVFRYIISSRAVIGFTTGGHTGEDVFLASYHPKGRTAHGLLDGTEINKYLLAELGLTGALDRLTDQIYSPHTDVFKGMMYGIVEDEDTETITLKVENGTKSLSIDGNTNIAVINGRRVELPSVAVYMSDNETFYLPRNLRDRLKNADDWRRK
ncbi:MAG: alkaline phosphatase [Acidobacteria bacterium]|nr:alkaline phosphatase [Acidobacteriota bacterium]